MSVFINRVTVTGYLTRDPELQCLPSGASVCNVTIAANARRKNKQTGDWYEKPNFFDIVIFGGQGETVARFMRKGRPIAVDGRLDWRRWQTKDGRTAHDVSVIADTVQFIGDPPPRDTTQTETRSDGADGEPDGWGQPQPTADATPDRWPASDGQQVSSGTEARQGGWFAGDPAEREPSAEQAELDFDLFAGQTVEAA